MVLKHEEAVKNNDYIEKENPLFVGVDRMHSCWIVAEMQNNVVRTRKYKHISEICEAYKNATDILIDMPIGLPESLEEDEMRPDKIARKLLFGERKSSIFPVPCRQAVWEECEEKAKEINKKVLGKSLSKQSFSICKTIKQIDEYLDKNPQWKNRLCESHPEVAFQMLNHGQGLRFSKHKEEGIAERIEILDCYGINIQQTLKEFKREE